MTLETGPKKDQSQSSVMHKQHKYSSLLSHYHPSHGSRVTKTPLRVQASIDSNIPGKRSSSSSFLNLLHILRLRILLCFCQEYRPEEQKVAIARDGFSACLAIVLHAIPLSICVFIICLNVRGVYIGRDLPGAVALSSFQLLCLQIAAKLVELIVSASLSALVFSKLRNHLVFSKGIPLGAVAVCFNISTISNLWSPEFLALCKSKFAPFRRRAFFVILLITATFLNLFVGPSSATSLIPAVNKWPGGGTTFWLNSTYSELFPQIVNASHAPSYRCHPSSGTPCVSRVWNPIADGIFSYWPRVGDVKTEMIRNAYIPGLQSLRPLTVRLVGMFVLNPGISMASINSAAISAAVSQLCTMWVTANVAAINLGFTRSFRFYNDFTCATQTLQPAVFVRCNANTVSPAQSLKDLEFISPTGTPTTPDLAGKNASLLYPDVLTQIHDTISVPQVLWVSLTETQPSKSTSYLGAVVRTPAISAENTQSGSQVLSCVMDARWVNASTTVTFSNGPKAISGSLQDDLTTGLFNMGQGITDYARVQLTMDWVETINVFIDHDNATVFEKLCVAAGLQQWQDDLDINGNLASEPVHAVEAVIATMLANAMGLIAADSTMQGTLKPSYPTDSPHTVKRNDSTDNWQTAVLNSHAAFYPPLPSTSASLSRHVFSVSVNGYGYGISIPNILSMIVLASYVVLSMYFIIELLMRRQSTSHSWDNVCEVLTLAMRSEKCTDERLVNTGAGIDSLASYKTKIEIRVEEGNLELRTVDEAAIVDGEDDEKTRVKMNIKYG